MSALFEPLMMREVCFRNRVFVSPMCQYSSIDGLPGDWHLTHLGARAVGGAGLVMVEATAVTPEGRISPFDSGMWSADHGHAWGRVARFVREQGAVAGIQLSHAGRKASVDVPWRGDRPLEHAEGGWDPVGPGPLPFSPESLAPHPLDPDDMARIVEHFAQAARWSAEAGFEVVEVHMAHGYLLHQFLSPLSNQRTDRYGGDLANRMRFPLEIARAVRQAWPEEKPVFVRISATDWVEGGWDLEQSIALAQELKRAGVDLVDCSSGGIVPRVRIPVGPGYQVPFAARIRADAGIPTGAVGLITDPQQAERIVAEGSADAVLLARAFLRDPYWAHNAATALGVTLPRPAQYLRA